MSKLITDTQKHEIEELTVEHCDALIAYGADMYRRGWFNGVIGVSVCGIAAFAIMRGVEVIKQHRTR